jgi:hypothetical protein
MNFNLRNIQSEIMWFLKMVNNLFSIIYIVIDQTLDDRFQTLLNNLLNQQNKISINLGHSLINNILDQIANI